MKARDKMENFNDLYKRNFKIVYAFLLNLSHNPDIAEEIAQQTFYIAFEKMHSYRGECKLSVWLCQIAKHEYFAWKKKNQRYQKETLYKPPASPGKSIEERIIEKEYLEKIIQIIYQLPEPYSEVFLLRTIAEMSHQEIGELLGKGENWSRVTYYRAKRKIIDCIGGLEDEM